MPGKALLLWIILASAALSQGFAGLGTKVDGFALPDPDRVLVFPADHGPHPGFRIEWWYLTANLTDANGRAYGVQWTLFRSESRPAGPGEVSAAWQSPELWMGHAALTTSTAHFVAERLARGGTGQAGVSLDAAGFQAWIDGWAMTGLAAAGSDPFSAMTVKAGGDGFGYDLTLRAEGPLVLHGAGSYSVKSETGQASHYYSQPFLRVEGRLDLPEGPVTVSGTAWLDREWSSQPLAPDQSGWDWFSLSFDNGEKLMGFVLRDGSGGFRSGSWIAADGTVEPLAEGALMAEPMDHATVAGRTVPVGWRLRLEDKGLDIHLTALNPDAWMATSLPYWEGPVTISGSHPGRGYLEMTGY